MSLRMKEQEEQVLVMPEHLASTITYVEYPRTLEPALCIQPTLPSVRFNEN